MLKSLSIYVFFSLLIMQLHAQNIGFDFMDTGEQTQRVGKVIESDDEHFIFTTFTFTDQNSLQNSKVWEIDEEGELVNQITLEHEDYERKLLTIVKQPGYYIGLGTSSTVEQDSNFLWYIKMDFDLSVIEEKLHYVGEIPMISINAETIQNELYLVGTLRPEATVYYPYIIKLTIEGDMLLFQQDFPLNDAFSSLIVKNEERLLIKGFRIWEADFDLNILSHHSAPFSLRPQGYMMKHTDSTFLLAGEYLVWPNLEQDIGICISNFQYDEITLQTFGGIGDTVDAPAFKQCIDINYLNEIYCAGNINDGYSLYSTYNNSIGLVKYDNNLNKLWERQYYPEDNFERMSGLIATSDNGCLMYGNIHNFNETPDVLSIFLLKVDSDGNVVLNTSVPIESSQLTIFPNPAVDYLNIDSQSSTDINLLEIRVINGAIVSSEIIQQHRTQIDIQDLTPGIYLATLKDRKGKTIGSKKFVKL